MAWFQRYGFAGAYFWGLLLLWIAALYNCELHNTLSSDVATAIGAIAAASFLPIGYISSILQQTIYLILRKPWIGITGRAIKNSSVFLATNEREYLLEAEACLVVMSKNIKKINEKIIKNENSDVDKQKFLQEWIRNRNNVMAINASLMVASILAILTALFGPKLLLKWEIQLEMRWFLFASIVTVLSFGILLLNWIILSKEVVRVEAGIYKMLANLPGSNLVLRNNISKEKAKDTK